MSRFRYDFIDKLGAGAAADYHNYRFFCLKPAVCKALETISGQKFLADRGACQNCLVSREIFQGFRKIAADFPGVWNGKFVGKAGSDVRFMNNGRNFPVFGSQNHRNAQFEYANKELSDMFALADLVVSRAGANAICELLALRKPNLLIPLSANASRGDQILNARSFERQGYSVVIEEEQLNSVILLDAVQKLFQNRNQYINAMAKSEQLNSVETVAQLLEEAANQK